MLPIPRRFSPSRHFPQLSWAWPDGSRQQLLVAAAHNSDDVAARAFGDWLRTTDLDDAQFAEQRLLVSAANRFPASVLEVPNRERLNGIVRMLWTKSRLAIGSAASTLGLLRSSGVEVLVFKGMAASALDMSGLKGRIAHDVDILVKCDHLERAITVLDESGWRAARGESVLLLKARGPRFRSLNFQRPPHGDIDLHTRAYLKTSPRSSVERDIWTRSTRTSFLKADVLVPSSTDRLMIAIAHGVVDAHRYSDWLVDCAQLIRKGSIDWRLVAELAAELHSSAHAAMALCYLRDILGADVPEEVARSLWQAASRSPVEYFEALMLGYPRDKHSPPSSLVRRAFKMRQNAQIKAASRSALPAVAPDIRLRRVRARGPDDCPWPCEALRHRLAFPAGTRRVSIVLSIGSVSVSRRYVFELNTRDRHLRRLRFRDMRGRGPLHLAATISIPEDVPTDDVWIEARQAGILTSPNSAEEAAVFGPATFTVSVTTEQAVARETARRIWRRFREAGVAVTRKTPRTA